MLDNAGLIRIWHVLIFQKLYAKLYLSYLREGHVLQLKALGAPGIKDR